MCSYSSKLETLLYKKIPLWFFLLIIIFGAVFTLLLAAAVRHYYLGGHQLKGLGPVVGSVAEFPSVVKKVLELQGDPTYTPEQRFAGQSGFSFNYTPGSRPDLGYVLVNRYDGDLNRSVSELWDLNTHEKIHQWKFTGVDAIWSDSKLKSNLGDFLINSSEKRFANQHAYLSEDGNIYTHSAGSPIVRLDTCSRISLFQDDAIYHHSLERDHSGNFWSPSKIENKTSTVDNKKIQNDGITLISLKGEVIYEKSVIKILEDNGLSYLVYGKSESVELDPIHLNDIQPVLIDGKFWKKGDVFLSLRNQSMLILYRPSTNKIIWHKQGPWIHQHDVSIVNDHQISIFNNNAFTTGMIGLTVRRSNNIFVYDFLKDEVTTPWQPGFEKLELRTITEGRGKIIGQEIFVEESNYGRLIQFLPDGSVSWQFINRASNGKTHFLNWSRIVSRELGDKVRISLTQKNCS